MRRLLKSALAVTAVLAAWSAYADDGIVVLACKGTMQTMYIDPKAKTDPILDPDDTAGITVNGRSRSVSFSIYSPVPVTKVTDSEVAFGGPSRTQGDAAWGLGPESVSIDGRVDRVTGEAEITVTYADHSNIAQQHVLRCRRSQRVI